MPLIQNPSIARKLQRFLRLVDFPDSVLAPETVSVILVEDLSAPLSDIDRGCMGGSSVGPVAAENPIIVLVRVGAPAPYDLTVHEVHFSTPDTQIVSLSVPTAGVTGLAVSSLTSFTDFELPGRPTSQLGLDTQVAIPANRNLFSVFALANTLYRIPLDIRIGTIGQASELTSLMISGLTVNTTLRGGFKWTESAPLG